MPTLLVLRHGKSDWRVDYGADADRPLAKRGRRAATLIGRHLGETGPEPELALTSPAVRARDTLERVLSAAAIDCPVLVVPSFYGHGTSAVVEELRAIAGSPETILIVGHEPTWSDLIDLFTGVDVAFPTGALATLDFDLDWADIDAGSGRLTALVLPRRLEAATR